MTSPDKPRDIIVVDLETTGLHRGADILEVAALNMTTGKEFHFVPYFDPSRIDRDNLKALQINRYFERGVWEAMCTPEGTSQNFRYLKGMLQDNTFAGSNPAFDAGLLAGKVWGWHHRLLDLSAYAAGVLGIPPNELPGLQAVRELLGVVNEDEHSALGDVRATADCFRKLMDYNE